jgi:hypothetical protein
MANWNIDGGLGADDYAAFLSSQGEVALYKGTDPASSTTWALQGVYWLGSPIGRRCFVQYGSDVAVISQDGLLPLSKELPQNRINSNVVALTDTIMDTYPKRIPAMGRTSAGR